MANMYKKRWKCKRWFMNIIIIYQNRK
jgi:hypothetical protein